MWFAAPTPPGAAVTGTARPLLLIGFVVVMFAAAGLAIVLGRRMVALRQAKALSADTGVLKGAMRGSDATFSPEWLAETRALTDDGPKQSWAEMILGPGAVHDPDGPVSQESSLPPEIAAARSGPSTDQPVAEEPTPTWGVVEEDPLAAAWSGGLDDAASAWTPAPVEPTIESAVESATASAAALGPSPSASPAPTLVATVVEPTPEPSTEPPVAEESITAPVVEEPVTVPVAVEPVTVEPVAEVAEAVPQPDAAPAPVAAVGKRMASGPVLTGPAGPPVRGKRMAAVPVDAPQAPTEDSLAAAGDPPGAPFLVENYLDDED